jgi:hypothetical protein
MPETAVFLFVVLQLGNNRNGIWIIVVFLWLLDLDFWLALKLLLVQ